MFSYVPLPHCFSEGHHRVFRYRSFLHSLLAPFLKCSVLDFKNFISFAPVIVSTSKWVTKSRKYTSLIKPKYHSLLKYKLHPLSTCFRTTCRKTDCHWPKFGIIINFFFCVSFGIFLFCPILEWIAYTSSLNEVYRVFFPRFPRSQVGAMLSWRLRGGSANPCFFLVCWHWKMALGGNHDY